jgi:hypothetical protein
MSLTAQIPHPETDHVRNLRALQGSTTAILTLAGDKTITDANKAALHLLGCPRDKAVGQHYGRFLQFDYAGQFSSTLPALRDPIAGCMHSEKSFYVQGKLQSPFGGSHPIEAWLTPLHKGLVVSGVLVMMEMLQSEKETKH